MSKLLWSCANYSDLIHSYLDFLWFDSILLAHGGELISYFAEVISNDLLKKSCQSPVLSLLLQRADMYFLQCTSMKSIYHTSQYISIITCLFLIFVYFWARFEPVQNVSSGMVKWSCAVVITTTPQPVWCL